MLGSGFVHVLQRLVNFFGKIEKVGKFKEMSEKYHDSGNLLSKILELGEKM